MIGHIFVYYYFIYYDGTIENEHIAEKLCDPEAYYSKWKGDKDYKKHKEQALKEWKEKNWDNEKKKTQLQTKIKILEEISILEADEKKRVRK